METTICGWSLGLRPRECKREWTPLHDWGSRDYTIHTYSLPTRVGRLKVCLGHNDNSCTRGVCRETNKAIFITTCGHQELAGASPNLQAYAGKRCF